MGVVDIMKYYKFGNNYNSSRHYNWSTQGLQIGARGITNWKFFSFLLSFELMCSAEYKLQNTSNRMLGVIIEEAG